MTAVCFIGFIDRLDLPAVGQVLLLVFGPTLKHFYALFMSIHMQLSITFIYSHNKINAHVFLSKSHDLMPLEDLVRERANMLYVIILYYIILYFIFVICYI